MGSPLFDPATVLLCLVIGTILDLAYLYYKIARAKDLASGGEAITGGFIFLVALIIMWAAAYGLLTT